MYVYNIELDFTMEIIFSQKKKERKKEKFIPLDTIQPFMRIHSLSALTFCRSLSLLPELSFSFSPFPFVAFQNV